MLSLLEVVGKSTIYTYRKSCFIIIISKGKADKDASLMKYGYIPAPQKAPKHAADPEREGRDQYSEFRAGPHVAGF